MRYQAATNLFAGLSRYSLKPKKICAGEFLHRVTCLVFAKLPSFPRRVLEINKTGFVEEFSRSHSNRTQQYWTYKGNDEEDEDNEGQAEPKAGMSGFFDLEIQSARQTNGKRDFLIAIESKIGADFELGQLEKYRAELKKRSINFSQSYLVTLTTHSTRPALADAHIKWSQVQELLSKAPLEDNLKNLEDHLPAVRGFS